MNLKTAVGIVPSAVFHLVMRERKRPWIKVATSRVESPRRKRFKPSSGFYRSNKWIAVRNERRRIDPLCVRCKHWGKIVEMKVVDHILPRRFWPELELNINNTQSLCESCHNAKSLNEQYVVDKKTALDSLKKFAGGDLDYLVAIRTIIKQFDVVI